MALTDWRDYIAEEYNPRAAFIWFWIVRLGIWSVFALGFISLLTLYSEALR